MLRNFNSRNNKKIIKKIVRINNCIAKNRIIKISAYIRLTYLNVKAFFKNYKLEKDKIDLHDYVPEEVISENKNIVYSPLTDTFIDPIQEEYDYQKELLNYSKEKQLYLKEKQRLLIKKLYR